MTAFEIFSVVAHDADVELISKHFVDLANTDWFSRTLGDSALSQQERNISKRNFFFSENFEGFPHDFAFFRVYFNPSGIFVIDVAIGSLRRPDAIPDLLAETSLDVFREIVDVILRLTESKVEHKFALGSIVKPEGRKFEVEKFAGVEKVDQISSINRVSGQPVRVPGKNGVGLATFDFV